MKSSNHDIGYIYMATFVFFILNLNFVSNADSYCPFYYCLDISFVFWYYISRIYKCFWKLWWCCFGSSKKQFFGKR